MPEYARFVEGVLVGIGVSLIANGVRLRFFTQTARRDQSFASGLGNVASLRQIAEGCVLIAAAATGAFQSMVAFALAAALALTAYWLRGQERRTLRVRR